LNAVYARLSASGSGFNDGVVANAPNYGLPVDFISVDWTTSSLNFMKAQIDPQLLEKSGTFKYPFSCLYVLESNFTGEQKFNQWSGSVICVFDVYLSWVPIKGLQNHEAYSLCVEDVVTDVINRKENQNWSPVVYNGMIKCRRGPLDFGGENFKQRVAFAMTFGLHQ
jgi:hypothetical protein